ncbi:MAG: hypothetical protein J7M06_03190 [Proteobacteria bacterium]|nr:hypothetical protein [Pseudomonadota bacterium]
MAKAIYKEMVKNMGNNLNLNSRRHFDSTARRKWLTALAKLIQRSDRPILKLPDWYPHQHRWIDYLPEKSYGHIVKVTIKNLYR